MIKAHKIRLNPSPEQELYFRKAAGTARFVYNWGWRSGSVTKPLIPARHMECWRSRKTSTLSKGSNAPGL